MPPYVWGGNHVERLRVENKLPFVHSSRTWLTLPPWEREPVLYPLFHQAEAA